MEIRSFEQSLPMALLRAREAAMRMFRPMLAEHDLSEQQWRVLRALHAGGSLEVGELAEATFLLGPSLSRILARLDADGLVERATVAHDQRRSCISLTNTGSAMVAEVAPRSEALYAQIEATVGADKMTELFDLLSLVETMTPEDPQRLASAS